MRPAHLCIEVKLVRQTSTVNINHFCHNMCCCLFQKECPNGKISRRKFTGLYKKMFPDGKTIAFYQHMFRTFDTDNSGTLEFDEFMEVVTSGITIIFRWTDRPIGLGLLI